ncbi:MAG: hypothetical protein KC503_34985 [Myxococcales bacterium]|nr:hypothetical protein [Myxococcales bacterium]
MYRDDLEALEARVQTLEAELEAERCSREAAQAEARAARAAANEADLNARRSGFATHGDGSWGSGGCRSGLGQHWGGAMVLLLLAITGAMMLSQLCTRSRYAGHLGERLRRARLAAARCERASMYPAGRTALSAAREALASARSAYVAADYSRAAALASTVLLHDEENPDGLLVYAASQCSLRNARSARAALRRIENSARRAIIRSVCARHGVELGKVRPLTKKQSSASQRAANEAKDDQASKGDNSKASKASKTAENYLADPLDVGARDPFATPSDARQ